ncbi:unnamed protein product [Brassica rapa subsp. narinosa]|uniref:(rape) hypothetical protein n=2 Tax=Brassica TaxID=3705 RepID=A0A816Z3Z6_BRANA|nr:unnamed protein product [Brassica napus]
MHRLCCVVTSFSVCFLRNRCSMKLLNEHFALFYCRDNSCVVMTSLLWLTAEEAAKNRGKVLSLYRQLLRSVNSPKLQLSYASRLAKKAEIKTIFLFGSEEISKHNVADLIRTGEYALSQLKQGKIPNNTTQY